MYFDQQKYKKDKYGNDVIIGDANLLNAVNTGYLIELQKYDLWHNIRWLGATNIKGCLSLIGLGTYRSSITDCVFIYDGTAIVQSASSSAYEARRNNIKHIVYKENPDKGDKGSIILSNGECIALEEVFSNTRDLRGLCSPWTFKHNHLELTRKGGIACCAYGVISENGKILAYMNVVGYHIHLNRLALEMDKAGILWYHVNNGKTNTAEFIVDIDKMISWSYKDIRIGYDMIPLRLGINESSLSNKYCINVMKGQGGIDSVKCDPGHAKEAIKIINKNLAKKG